MTESAPPDWYPDGSGQMRYWDGRQWTITEAEYEALTRRVEPHGSAAASASAVASEMSGRYIGRDGSLVVDGGFVTIEHHDRSIPDFRVPLSSVTAVHFEPATRFVSGILTIAVNGEPLAVPTGTACGSDLRTVVFRHTTNDTFYGVQEWLSQIAAANLDV